MPGTQKQNQTEKYLAEILIFSNVRPFIIVKRLSDNFYIFILKYRKLFNIGYKIDILAHYNF